MSLKDSVRALGKEYGLAAVAREAVGQHEMEKVWLLAKGYSGDGVTPRVARIVVATIVFDQRYDEARDWVEAKFDDNGNGDPV